MVSNNVIKNRSFHRYLVLDILTDPNRVTHTKKSNILRKNPLPISLFTRYSSLKIKFASFLEKLASYNFMQNIDNVSPNFGSCAYAKNKKSCLVGKYTCVHLFVKWIERPPGVWEVGPNPVGYSDFFFVQRLWHADYSIFTYACFVAKLICSHSYAN